VLGNGGAIRSRSSSRSSGAPGPSSPTSVYPAPVPRPARRRQAPTEYVIVWALERTSLSPPDRPDGSASE